MVCGHVQAVEPAHTFSNARPCHFRRTRYGQK
jgi:hypothetical protein